MRKSVILSGDSILFILFFLVLPVGLFFRIHFGVDIADEPFYIATAKRLAQGVKPFVDELHFAQTAALFLSVPLKIYLKVQNLDGLVLFSRLCFAIFSLSVASSLYFLLRKKIGNTNSLMLSSLYLAFIPVANPVLNYNSLALGFFTLGLFLNALPLDRSPYLFLTGLSLALASFAYPPLLPVALMLVAIKKNQSRLEMFYRLAGFLAVGLTFFLLIEADFSRLGNLLQFLKNYDPDRKLNLAKLIGFFAPFAKHPWKLIPFLLVGFLIFTMRQAPSSSKRWSLSFVPILLWALASTRLGGGGLSHFVIYLGLLPIFFYFLSGDESDDPADKERWFKFVVLPSWLIGAVFALSSHMEASAVSVGIFPAALLGSYWLIKLSRTRWTFALILLGMLSFWRNHYFESAPNIFKCRVSVSEGAYRGIYICPPQSDLLRDLQNDLKSVGQEQKNISAIYSELPISHLLAEYPAGMPTSYFVKCAGDLARYCQKKPSLWAVSNQFKSAKIGAETFEKQAALKLRRLRENAHYSLYLSE